MLDAQDAHGNVSAYGRAAAPWEIASAVDAAIQRHIDAGRVYIGDRSDILVSDGVFFYSLLIRIDSRLLDRREHLDVISV